MAELTISLSDEHLTQLQAWANQSGLAPEEFLRQHIQALLKERDESFQQAAAQVLQKNADLYQRLA